MSPFAAVAVYRGRLRDAVKRVKLISVGSAAVTTLASPLLVLAETNAPPTAIGSMAFIMIGFSLGTTALCHAVARRYVTAMYRGGCDDGDENVTIETLSVLGRPVRRPVRIGDLARSTALFSNLTHAPSGNHYFVHDADVSVAVTGGQLPTAMRTVLAA